MDNANTSKNKPHPKNLHRQISYLESEIERTQKSRMILYLDKIQVESQKLKNIVSSILWFIATIAFYVFILTRIYLSNK